MSGIRVTYSGLIGFVVAIISVLTGIFFTIIVTRRLPPEEFAIWTIIGSMVGYFLIIEPIISYWSTRQIARGESVGKSSIYSSTIFSVGSIPIYFVIAFFISDINPKYFDSILLAAMLVPVTFVSQTLMGINLGHKPHVTSYSILGFEILKIPSGLILVYFLDLGLDGAIIATMIAYGGKLAIQLYFARVKLYNKFCLSEVRYWLKLSWIPLYTKIPHVIWSSDVIAFPLITGSLVGVAYYAASNAISSVVGHASMISQALYPKLLAERNFDYVKENFARLMYFSIPLLGIAIVFSKPALFTLNPSYSDAWIVVIILSFRTFFYVIASTFSNVLLGLEKIDIEKNHTFRKLIKSKLLFLPTVTNLHYGIYIISLIVILSISTTAGTNDLQLVTWWSILILGLQIPFTIYYWKLVKNELKFLIPFASIGKYILATSVMILIFYMTSDYILNYEISIFDFIPTLIAELAICISIYLLITYTIDKKTRILFNAIINELK